MSGLLVRFLALPFSELGLTTDWQFLLKVANGQYNELASKRNILTHRHSIAKFGGALEDDTNTYFDSYRTRMDSATKVGNQTKRRPSRIAKPGVLCCCGSCRPTFQDRGNCLRAT